MILARLVLARALGWCLLAAALVAGLAALATAVEAADRGLGQALLLAALQLPGVLVPLSPVLAALGAALAAARMAALGEADAIAGAGISPWRAGLWAAAAGLLLGAAQLAAADALVPRAEAARARLSPGAQAPWIWLDDGALRTADSTWVSLEGGRIASVGPAPAGRWDEPTLARARERQQPRLASAAALAESDASTATLERHSRLARALSCAALALLAWLPTASGAAHVGWALAFGLAWQVADLLLYGAAAAGRLSPALGGWGAAGLVVAALGLRWGAESWRQR